MEAIHQNLQLLKAGNQHGLGFFVDHYIKPLTLFAAKLVQSEVAAEEIVCDTFLKLWDSREKIASGEHVKSFLYTVTRHACINHVASPKNNVRFEADYAEDLAHPDDDVLTKMVHAELIQQLYEQIENLPKQQATIFRMSYLEGYSTEEICELLGTTPSNVFYAKSKATQTLRKVFQDKNILLFAAFLHITTV